MYQDCMKMTCFIAFYGRAYTLEQIMNKTNHLLPTGSDDRGVIEVGSIYVTILCSCQHMQDDTFGFMTINLVGQ